MVNGVLQVFKWQHVGTSLNAIMGLAINIYSITIYSRPQGHIQTMEYYHLVSISHCFCSTSAETDITSWYWQIIVYHKMFIINPLIGTADLGEIV